MTLTCEVTILATATSLPPLRLSLGRDETNMRRHRCHCARCRAMDERARAERDRRFWQVVTPLERNRLNLPAVPEWDGEPAELQLYRVTRKGDRT